MTTSSFNNHHLHPKLLGHPKFHEVSEKEKRILGTVMRREQISQTRLAGLTGIAQQSVSRTVKHLIARGALCRGKKIVSGKRGQQQTNLEIAPNFAYSFGMSIMTDALYICAMDFSGNVLGEEHASLLPMKQSTVIKTAKKIIANLTKEHIDHPENIFGIGVSISGYFVDKGITINTHPMLDDWALIDIQDILSKQFDLPVWLENDGNAAAIGESLVGVGKRYDNFVYLFIAAGFGGGVISDGDLLHGTRGNAGELATLLPKDIYPEPTLEFLRHILVSNGVKLKSVSELVDHFDINWPGVDEWISRVTSSFSLVASASSAILDTEAIVLGGRIPKQLADALVPHIVLTNYPSRRSRPRKLPVVISAEAPSDASAIGAAALPFNEYFFGSPH